MPKGTSKQTSILEYALKGLEQERDHIQSMIDEIKAQLGDAPVAVEAPEEEETAAPVVVKAVKAPKAAKPAKEVKKAGVKRVLSPEARERIAAAQRKRWAAAGKAKK